MALTQIKTLFVKNQAIYEMFIISRIKAEESEKTDLDEYRIFTKNYKFD